MAKRSTVSALIRAVEDWLYAYALDQGFKVCVVFFDISKAFDTVPHLALLHKLQEIGLNPHPSYAGSEVTSVNNLSTSALMALTLILKNLKFNAN